MNKTLCTALAVAALSSAFTANAVPIASRAALQTLLGGSSTLEDFESYSIGGGNAATLLCSAGNVLDATSTCNGQGPGLVEAGVAFIKPSDGGFQWDGAGYFGSTSREFLIGSPAAQPLIIDFLNPVGAFGVDLRAFSGFAATATLQVRGVDDATIIGTMSAIALGSSGASVFAGWTDLVGIGSVVLTQTGQSWSPIIDNLQWGLTSTPPPTTTVPEPGSMLLLGLGLIALGCFRRLRAS